MKSGEQDNMNVKKFKGLWRHKSENVCAPIKTTIQDNYHLLIEQLDDIIFEIDFNKKEFTISPKYYDKFGVYFDEKSCIEGDIKNLNLHPDDECIWTSIKNQIDQNKPSITEQVRVCNNKGEYIWCQIVIKCIFDRERLKFIYGKIIDIQCKMRKDLH